MISKAKKVGIILLAIVALNSCGDEKFEKVTKKPVKVKTVYAIEKELSIPIHSVGKLYSKAELKLSFKTGGIIKQIFVEEGQTVRKGQVLAQLNLSEIQAQVDQASLGLEKAKRDFKRVKNLYNDSVATLEQYQNALTALDFAKANVEIAQFNLKFSRIKAPSKGKILKKLAENNEISAPGYPILLFGSTENAWVIRVSLTDKDIFKVKIGDKAEVEFDAYPDKLLSASISEIGRAADLYTGTYEVELKINNDDIELASGLIAYTDIFPSETKKYTVVPINALIEGNNNYAYIYSIDKNNIAKKIKIKVHKITNDNIIVKSGIKKGLKIITSGASYVSDGDKVETSKEVATLKNR